MREGDRGLHADSDRVIKQRKSKNLFEVIYRN